MLSSSFSLFHFPLLLPFRSPASHTLPHTPFSYPSILLKNPAKLPRFEKFRLITYCVLFLQLIPPFAYIFLLKCSFFLSPSLFRSLTHSLSPLAVSVHYAPPALCTFIHFVAVYLYAIDDCLKEITFEKL